MIVKLRTGLKHFEDSDVPCALNASAVQALKIYIGFMQVEKICACHPSSLYVSRKQPESRRWAILP